MAFCEQIGSLSMTDWKTLFMLAFTKLSVMKPEYLFLYVCMWVSTSPRKNPECSGKCSATNVSKVSAVLLAMSAESGE